MYSEIIAERCCISDSSLIFKFIPIMEFPSKKIKIYGYLLIGIMFYMTILLINPWEYTFDRNFFLKSTIEFSISLVGVIVIMELSILVSKKLDMIAPWRNSVFKRILIQLSAQIILVGFMIFIFQLLMPKLFVDEIGLRQSLITGVILSTLFSSIFTAVLFFSEWNSAKLEVAEQEKKIAKVELEFLKMQINPHFLFNNLSTLTSLIEDDQRLAVEYVQRLSKIYRHTLKKDEQYIVSVSEELEFIRSYLFLYEIRYQEGLSVKIDIPPAIMGKGIATATMQLLVENAIKHNSISRQNPLGIDIFVQDEAIIVKNNINPVMKTQHSSGIGLKNISERYMLLSDKAITITHDKEVFIVKIPLLEQ